MRRIGRIVTIVLKASAFRKLNDASVYYGVNRQATLMPIRTIKP